MTTQDFLNQSKRLGRGLLHHFISRKLVFFETHTQSSRRQASTWFSSPLFFSSFLFEGHHDSATTSCLFSQARALYLVLEIMILNTQSHRNGTAEPRGAQREEKPDLLPRVLATRKTEGRGGLSSQRGDLPEGGGLRGTEHSRPSAGSTSPPQAPAAPRPTAAPRERGTRRQCWDVPRQTPPPSNAVAATTQLSARTHALSQSAANKPSARVTCCTSNVFSAGGMLDGNYPESLRNIPTPRSMRVQQNQMP